MKLTIREDSLNYACQVIKLPPKQKVEGLDRLVKITYQGNDVLTQKDSDEEQLYLFFPCESQISEEYLAANNEFRHTNLNRDTTTKPGFFEDSGRCKAIKFKGVISTGYIAPIFTLVTAFPKLPVGDLKEGDEFTDIDGINICRKYIIRQKSAGANLGKSSKVLDKIVDSRLAPEHFNTEHLLKNCHRLNVDDYVAITHKLHGTSARYFNTLVFRKLNWFEKILKRFGIKIVTEEYKEVVGSRQVIKSIGFNELEGKSHYYKEAGDIWTKVGAEHFKGKLNKGEAVYCEIVGKTHTGGDIQKGYSYGFDKPEVFIYRISNINSQGIEVDLSYNQMKERANQMGIKVCPEYFYGKLSELIQIRDDRDKEPMLEALLYGKLLEQPSILDNSVVEEGFCIRIDKYPKPSIYKIKSKKFLLHEGVQADKQEVNIEDDQII